MFSSLLKFFGKTPDRYVSPKAFSENRTMQTAMTPETMSELRKHGVSEEKELKLEFFFYTDTEAKASELVAVLKMKEYSVEQRPSTDSDSLQVITGWTTAMKMTDEIVMWWAREMCELGYASDCEFDGWGTDPTQ